MGESRQTVAATVPERDNWGNDIEFLMSCIAMSVGLGNVWRFPFTALENGGGAFLIPYLIVLAVVGRPIYYLEMIVGQFSSRGSAKVYDLCPAMRGEFRIIRVFVLRTFYHRHFHSGNIIIHRAFTILGVGYGQLMSTALVMTYYIVLMAISLRYMVDSMGSTLPWAKCRTGWGEEECSSNGTTGRFSAAELYFV